MEDGIDEGKRGKQLRWAATSLFNHLICFDFRGIQAGPSTLITGSEDDQLSQVSTGIGNQTGIVHDQMIFSI